jgi:hypothetical protein
MRDPCTSYDILPDEVLNSLPPNPIIIELEVRSDELQNGKYRLQGSDDEKEVRQLTI